MIVKKAEKVQKKMQSGLQIEVKQKMRGQSRRIFLNLVQVDSSTKEKTELYLADFPLEEKKNILTWLMEPCRRRALQSADTLWIEKSCMMDGYNDLFKHVVLI